jgi:hypothetical protein
LAARPDGEPKPTDWAFTEEPVPTPEDGQLVVKISHVSIDPAMRAWMDDRPSYIPPVGLKDVMRAVAAGTVVKSKNPDYAPGDLVTGMLGVQDYALSGGGSVFDLSKVDRSVPLPLALSALGPTGLTAYFGLLDVGALTDGETVLVSGAAGATGGMVGQIAKLKGCRVIGIAGGPAKCARLTDDFGFDAALDYRSGNLAKQLARLAPGGVDVFFDNVGGEILDIGLTRLAMHARVVICGAISQYNHRNHVEGPSNYLNLVTKRARMEGFLIFDHADRVPAAATEISGWLADGRIRCQEHVVEGSVADFPDTLRMLFRGENTGKMILKIS